MDPSRTDSGDERWHVSWRAAVPFSAWLAAPSLRRRSTLVFVIIVTAPAVIFAYVSGLPATPHSPSYDFKALGWAFAAYIGAAWLIVLWLIIRPRLVAWHAALIVGLALMSQVPLAIWLENRLHGNITSVVPAIVTVALPEEVAKLVPLLGALAITYFVARDRLRTWLDLSPRSYLFLGAISGLAFGCAEQAHYLVSVYVPQLLNSPNSLDSAYSYTVQITWRLISDPISHACWAGVTGYFIGIAVQRLRFIPPAQRRYPREIEIALIGLAIAAILHGLNDAVAAANDQLLWILVTTLSTILFIAYATAGEVVEKAFAGIARSAWIFRTGDRVRLPADPPWGFQNRFQQARWHQEMASYLGSAAVVTALQEDRTARLDVDRGMNLWALDWLRPLLRVGDSVRLPRDPQPVFDAGGYVVSWQPDMTFLCGRSGTVTAVLSSGTVHLDIGRPEQEWPIEWLERLTSEQVPP